MVEEGNKHTAPFEFFFGFLDRIQPMPTANISLVDLALGFATQFVIFYFILTRLNDFLGLGRVQGALVLAAIVTGFHALYSFKTGRHLFY